MTFVIFYINCFKNYCFIFFKYESFCFREVNEDNMVFRNISTEFLEDTVVSVSIVYNF